MKRALVVIAALAALAVPTPADASAGRVNISCQYYSPKEPVLSTGCYGTSYVHRGVVYRRFGALVHHPASMGRLTVVCGFGGHRRTLVGKTVAGRPDLTIVECSQFSETLISYRWTAIRPPIRQGDGS